MEKNKEIGKLFKEKLEFLDKSPKQQGWNAIRTELDNKKKKRYFFIPFWLKGISVLSIGIIMLWLSVLNTENSNKTNLTNENDSKKSNEKLKQDKNIDSQVRTLKVFKESEVLDTQTNSKTTDTLDKINLLQNKRKNENEIYNYDKLSSIKSINKPEKNIKKTALTNINKSKIKAKATKVNFSKTKKYGNSQTNNQSLTNKIGKNTNKSNYSKSTSSIKNETNQLIEVKKTSVLKSDISNLENSNLESELNKINSSNGPTKEILKNSTISATNKRELILEKRKLDKIAKIKKKDSLVTAKVKIEIKKSKVKDSTEIKKEVKNTFEIFVYGAPNLGVKNFKSALDSRLDTNNKTSQITFNYGGYICFQTSERLSFRVGAEKTSVTFITDDVQINTSNYSNINYATGFSNAFIYKQSKNTQKMKLTQELSYTELPLEVKYAIINKKIGVNGIGRFSYLFLNNNTVNAETNNGMKFNIGETSRIFERTFGINLGVGIDYKITKRLKFNIEPMLKYNLKASDNDGTNPISISVLSGFQIIIGEQ